MGGQFNEQKEQANFERNFAKFASPEMSREVALAGWMWRAREASKRANDPTIEKVYYVYYTCNAGQRSVKLSATGPKAALAKAEQQWPTRNWTHAVKYHPYQKKGDTK